MKVKRIDLDDEGMPEAVLVELSHAEATYVALLVGQQTGATAEQVAPGGSRLNGSIYDGLAGDLFNRFYEDGVDGAVTAMRARP